MSGSLYSKDFSIDMAAIRIAVVGCAGVLLLAALVRMRSEDAIWPARVAEVAWGGQILFALVIACLLPVALDIANDLSGEGDGEQNLIRNANWAALAMPVFVTAISKRGLGGRLLAVAAFVAMVVAAGALGAHSALLGVLGAVVAVMLVWAAPQSGFRILLVSAAILVLVMPLLAAALCWGVAAAGASVWIPPSFAARLWCWEYINAKIAQKPLLGHGLEAAGGWRETYATRPDLMEILPEHWSRYPIVPGHPHNMPLEIWAETGAVGAFLAAMALILLARRLPAPESLSPRLRTAAGGIIGAAL
ncbi:MAG: O-antigen ligase family protein, partial [Pseudomonadota bacterium]